MKRKSKKYIKDKLHELHEILYYADYKEEDNLLEKFIREILEDGAEKMANDLVVSIEKSAFHFGAERMREEIIKYLATADVESFRDLVNQIKSIVVKYEKVSRQ